MMSLVLQAKKQPTQSDCLECRVFEDPDDSTRVMLLWPASSTLIVEEHMSTDLFNNLLNEKPFLIWVKGAFSCEDETSVVEASKFTNLETLNNRNTDAISQALVENSNSTVISILTDDKGEDNSSPPQNLNSEQGLVVHTANATESLEAVIDNDGEENITVHTVHTPSKVLQDEKDLVDYLGALNNPKTGVKERQLNVGGHDVTVQTFHYPALNLEAPRNKRLRTYVNKENLPQLYSYESKEVMTLNLNIRVANGKLGKKVAQHYAFVIKSTYIQ